MVSMRFKNLLTLAVIGCSYFVVNSLKARQEGDFLTVGILTMPPSKDEMKMVGHGHYIVEMADIFMRQSSLFPVFIPYNITDEDLYPLLDSVNGVYFTGGDLDLYNPVTNVPHPYTETSMKIFNYAINHTDNGDYFPLIGVCQGHELFHILAANNSYALGWSLLENQHVNTNFLLNPKVHSRYLSKFEDELIDAMENTNILWHAHQRGIPLLHYIKYPKLNEFFKIISINNIDGINIVATVEAKKYPIYMTQYHPEIVIEPASDINAIRTQITSRVAQSFVNFFADECAKNQHRFVDKEDLQRKLIKNGFRVQIPFMREAVNAFAFDY